VLGPFFREEVMKRWRQGILVWLFVGLMGVSLVAKAFLFPLVPGVALAFESGAMAASYAAAVGFVGSVLYWLDVSSSNEQQAPSLKVRVTETAPMPVPTGWTAASTPASDPVPPSTGPEPSSSNGGSFDLQAWPSVAHVQGGSLVLVCQAAGAYYAANPVGGYSNVSHSYQSGTGKCRVTYNGGSTFDLAASAIGSVCPSGYGYNSGQSPPACTLSNAALVKYPADGKCIVKTSNGTFTGDGRDPDCTQSVLSNMTSKSIDVGAEGAGRVMVVIDSSGRLVVADGKPVEAGWEVATYRTDKKLDGKQYLSQGTQETVAADQNGYQYVGGIGAANKGSEGSSAACGGPGLPACTMDDSGFKGATDGLTQAKQAAIDAAAGQGDELAKVQAGQSGNLDVTTSWIHLEQLLPNGGVSVACSQMPITMGFGVGELAGISGTENLDICDKALVAREIMGWIMGIGTLLYLVRLLYRSNQGS
jgi:hypothetical protein